MKLRNKKTGQEGNFIINKDHFECVDLDYVPEYRNLAELNEEWEDYEEPKEYWYIDPIACGVYFTKIEKDKDLCEFNKQIGNYFETKEEAEKAVEKLKAWKRLKDKGFKVKSYDFDYLLYAHKDGTPVVKVICDFDCETEEDKKDLDLLFGGKK